MELTYKAKSAWEKLTDSELAECKGFLNLTSIFLTTERLNENALCKLYGRQKPPVLSRLKT